MKSFRKHIEYKEKIFSLLLILLEILLILIIFLLVIRIKEIYRENVKGAQFATLIKKDDIVFDNIENKLQYFYEPKPNNIEVWNPDWLDYSGRYTINADSLNERFDYSINEDKDTYRIITLGDSFTFGQYVNTENNYPEILEDLLNTNLKCNNIKHFDVINLGVHGYDIEYSAERYKKRGTKYNPDLVIWFLNNWNFTRINEYKIPRSQDLRREGYLDFDRETFKFPIMEKISREIINKYGENNLLVYQKNALIKIADYNKREMLYITFPSTQQKYKDIIINYSKVNLNWNYYDEMTDIRQNQSYSLPDGHPTKEGYRILAEDIFIYLAKNIITNCK